jgi:ring-1,2-phenylacetyl-CoA epoxidase subunit PaaB
MNDTQWPRYQVFLQEKQGEPHQDAGSVHAPDPEMALLNARDVFVRRPECVSLWVVEANRIYSRTAEGLKEQGRRGAREQGRKPPSPSGRVPVKTTGTVKTTGVGGEGEIKSTEDVGVNELYYVFCKMKPAGTQTWVGQIEARSPEEALQRAVEGFSVKGSASSGLGSPTAAPFSWWVFPVQAVIRSSTQDVESMFSPALNKPFRLSTDFRTLTAMREIKKPDPLHQEADHSAQSAASSASTNR